VEKSTKTWLVLSAIYVVFWFWYVGFNHKLDQSEADEIIEKMKFAGVDIEVDDLRKAISDDDGRSLIIVNLIKLNEPKEESSRLLNSYSRPFIIELFKRGGHPVMFSKAAGPAVEYWGVEAGAEEWDIIAAVRYRSLRDMFEMVTWPEFAKLHPYKKQAIQKTIAVPASPWTTLGGVPLNFFFLLIISGFLINRFRALKES
jgi:hypothetical protein